jgi:hypothetical protein
MRLEKAKKNSIHRCEVCGEQADVWLTGRLVRSLLPPVILST